jgi:hypothetical protein
LGRGNPKEAAEKLKSLIKPLPSFDEEVLHTKEERSERDRLVFRGVAGTFKGNQ